MGRAPNWLPEECETAAIAWIRATNNGIEGVEQRGKDFRNKVHNYMKAYSPPTAAENCFANRGATAVLDYLKGKIFPDIQKFNKSIRTVYASCPTGCNFPCMDPPHPFSSSSDDSLSRNRFPTISLIC
jgi:hypothetical protein